MKPKRKRKIKAPDYVNLLYKAVVNYVEANDGKLLIVGGISIQEWPHDNSHVFYVAIKCLGRKPKFV